MGRKPIIAVAGMMLAVALAGCQNGPQKTTVTPPNNTLKPNSPAVGNGSATNSGANNQLANLANSQQNNPQTAVQFPAGNNQSLGGYNSLTNGAGQNSKNWNTTPPQFQMNQPNGASGSSFGAPPAVGSMVPPNGQQSFGNPNSGSLPQQKINPPSNNLYPAGQANGMPLDPQPPAQPGGYYNSPGGVSQPAMPPTYSSPVTYPGAIPIIK